LLFRILYHGRKFAEDIIPKDEGFGQLEPKRPHFELSKDTPIFQRYQIIVTSNMGEL